MESPLRARARCRARRGCRISATRSGRRGVRHAACSLVGLTAGRPASDADREDLMRIRTLVLLSFSGALALGAGSLAAQTPSSQVPAEPGQTPRTPSTQAPKAHATADASAKAAGG